MASPVSVLVNIDSGNVSRCLVSAGAIRSCCATSLVSNVRKSCRDCCRATVLRSRSPAGSR
eukprot:9303233-Heterocapsa_arctica.AAC.1